MNALSLRIVLVFFFFCQLASSVLAQSGIITTIAGNGISGYSGDGGPATSAQFNGPYGIAVDMAGDLFIADKNNERVRKVTPDGVISTVAGNGTIGFNGDEGPATSAQLFGPYGVAVDTAGDLFIADAANERVRKVTPDGVISTVAGNGTSGYSGDGNSATSAQLNTPHAVAVDTAGNLFIADYGNNCIRKVTPNGVISTVAGNGSLGYSGDGGPATSAQLFDPDGVVVDAAGNIFIADKGNSCVRKVTPDGLINTVAGNGTSGYSGDGGPATSAQLIDPSGVVVDTAGNLFIADFGNNSVRKVTPDGVIRTVAGNGSPGYGGDGGPATSAQLNGPYGVAVDMWDNLIISDNANSRIRMVTLENSDFFPQVAVGGGWSTTFTFGNTGATVISGNLTLTDLQGNPLSVSSSNLGTGSSFPVSIAPGGTMFLTVNSINPDDPVKTGWARVATTSGSLSGVATFQLGSGGAVQTATGVLTSQPIQFATIPVNDDYSQNHITAYALANPTSQTIDVKLCLVDVNGNVVDDSVSFKVGPGQQIARYFYQDLNQSTFQGSVVLRAQGGGIFVAVALVQIQQLFVVIPVIPTKAPNIPN